MPDSSKYRQFSIAEERYLKILDEWKKSIRHLDKKKSFTSWVTETVEGGLLRQRLVSRLYPDFKVVTFEGAFIIENAKTNELVKVFLDGKKIDCSATQNKEDYIVFACLHPLFNV